MARRRAMGAVVPPGTPSQIAKTFTPPKSPTKPKTAPKKNVEPKQRRGKRGGYKYDWLKVKTDFVEGVPDEENPKERVFLNLRELSEHENVPLNLIRERSADERWFEQREQYQMRVVKTRQTKRVLELSEKSVDFDSKSLTVAQLGIAMVTKRMSEIARDVKEQDIKREKALELQQRGYAIDVEDLASAIDARELDTLARAASQWQVVGQKALGTDISRLEIQQELNASIDVDVEVTSISAELGRDDPERLASFLLAAKRAGLLDTVVDGAEQPAIEAGDEIIDGEIIEGEESA